MPKAPVYNTAGEQVAELELSEAVFAAPYNPSLLHQAVVMYQANRRQGTASTKTRAEVSGGGRKPWRQKGLGRARQGSTRSPIWRKGGIVFGPKPRSFRRRMPQKMRQAALRVALSAKLRDQELMIIDALELPQPKTRELKQILSNLQADGARVLLVTEDKHEDVLRSARNLERVAVMRASDLNAYEVLKHGRVIMTQAAVTRTEEVLAG